MIMENKLFYVFGSGLIAMLFAFVKTSWINKQDEGSDRMKKIGKSISEGAMAFLKAEYRILSIFVVVVACLLAFAANSQGDSWLISISFLVGAFASALAGSLGIKTFLILEDQNLPTWYWNFENNTSFWYNSIRKFQKPLFLSEINKKITQR